MADETAEPGKVPSAEPDELAEHVQAEIGRIGAPKPAPVDQWNPPFSGELDMRISRQGQWLYQGAPMQRQALIKLFSSILRRDADGCYYLVTPVEKFRIQVEDAPFVAHSLRVEGQGRDQILWLKNNVDDVFAIDRDHPLRVETRAGTEQPAPYVRVRGNLDALLERQAFYDLAALAVAGEGHFSGSLGVYSGGDFYPIGKAGLS